MERFDTDWTEWTVWTEWTEWTAWTSCCCCCWMMFTLTVTFQNSELSAAGWTHLLQIRQREREGKRKRDIFHLQTVSRETMKTAGVHLYLTPERWGVQKFWEDTDFRLLVTSSKKILKWWKDGGGAPTSPSSWLMCSCPPPRWSRPHFLERGWLQRLMTCSERWVGTRETKPLTWKTPKRISVFSGQEFSVFFVDYDYCCPPHSHGGKYIYKKLFFSHFGNQWKLVY